MSAPGGGGVGGWGGGGVVLKYSPDWAGDASNYPLTRHQANMSPVGTISDGMCQHRRGVDGVILQPPRTKFGSLPPPEPGALLCNILPRLLLDDSRCTTVRV